MPMVFLLLFTCLFIQADEKNDEETAKEKVIEYLQANAKYTSKANMARGRLGQTVKCVASKSFSTLSKSAMYVFNAKSVTGDILVITNAGLADVVGVTDCHVDNVDDIPAALEYYLSNMENTTVDDVSAQGDNSQRSAIEPLLSTKWNQKSPYDNLTPYINSAHAPTGCVATAMAQIMKFHRWPVKGTGSSSLSQYGLTADFENTVYQWDKMLDTYTSNASADEENAVATLMMHCGVAAKMSYGSKESGATVTNAMKGLRQYFNYRGVYLNRNDYPLHGWNQLIYDELINNRPVLYSGNNGYDNGHAFVCDGYDGQGFFHINWGWGGSYDGYFKLSSLIPSGIGTGGNSGNYSYKQYVLAGLESDLDGKEQPLFPVLPSFSFNSGSEGIYIPVPKFRYPSDGFAADYGIEIVDANGNSLGVEKMWNKEGIINDNFPSTSSTLLVPSIFPANGVFRIYPKARISWRTEWIGVPVLKGADNIIVTMVNGTMSLSQEEQETNLFDVNLRQGTKAYSQKTFSLVADFEGKSDVLKEISLRYRKKGTTPIYTLNSFQLGLEEGEKYSHSFYATIENVGEYEFFVWDGKEEKGLLNVTVNEYVIPEITITPRVYVENEYDANLKNLRLHIPLECKVGTFSEQIKVSLSSESGQGFPLFDVGLVQLEAGESKEIIYDMSIDSDDTFFGGGVYTLNNNVLTPLDNRGGSNFTFGRAVSFVSLTDNSTFTDAGFRAALKAADIDNDNRLSNVECRKITSLKLDGSISAIDGLASFPNLSFLAYKDGTLESIDLTGASKIVNLDLSNNKLTSIDLSCCPELLYLCLNKNQLTEVDLSKCQNLASVYIENNNLLTVDCSTNRQISSLSAAYNPNLNTFIPNETGTITYLNMSNCAFADIDLSGCTNIRDLVISHNKLRTLDIGPLEKLQWLSCEYNELEDINLYKTNVTYLNCSNNNLKKLEVRGFWNIVTLYCDNNQLCAIDLSYPQKLENFSCYNNVRYFSPCEKFYFTDYLKDLPLFTSTKAYDYTGADLSENGAYLTLKGNVVTYKYDVNNTKFNAPTFKWDFTNATGIDAPNDNPHGITLSGKTIDNPSGTTITIYDSIGRIVYHGNDRVINIPGNGIFMVKTKKWNKKIAIVS